MMNTKLKIGTIILLVTVFVIGGLIILNKQKSQMQRFSTISFSNLEIQWFRVSSDGEWLLITALDGHSAVSFTHRVEDAQKAKLPVVPGTPPINFTISSDGKTLTLCQVDGALVLFERKSEEDNIWQVSSKPAPGPCSMNRIWYNFSLPTHHGIEIHGETKPTWFPSIQNTDFGQGVIYAEQAVEAGSVAFISTSSPHNFVWIVDADGQDLRQLAPVDRTELRAGHKPFAWSPNGSRLFYELPANDGTGHKAIWVFEVSKGTYSLFVDGAYYPTVSPDGRWLAYRKPYYRETIETMDIETKKATGRTPGRYPVDWSPDGQSLAILDSKGRYPALIQFLRSFPFVLETPERSYFVRIVSHDGRTMATIPMPIYEERLPDWGYVDRWGKQDIQWSRDGRRVFFPCELDKICFAVISDE